MCSSSGGQIVCVCVCVCVCVYIYIYIYTHTHTHTTFGIVTFGADKERLDVPGLVFSFSSGEPPHQRRKRRPNQEHLVSLCLHQEWRYQMLYIYNLTSWWWAYYCSKHVEEYNIMWIKKFCALSWYLVNSLYHNARSEKHKVIRTHVLMTAWKISANKCQFLNDWCTNKQLYKRLPVSIHSYTHNGIPPSETELLYAQW